jgi:hypothetical protein
MAGRGCVYVGWVGGFFAGQKILQIVTLMPPSPNKNRVGIHSCLFADFYVNAIHSRVFKLDLPANIDFWNLYNSILAGESVYL